MKIHNPNPHSVLQFDFTKVVQQRLPNPILGEIVRDAFRDQNMTGIAAIHHALRNIDSDTGDVRLVVYIFQLIDWSAVHTHAQANMRMAL